MAHLEIGTFGESQGDLPFKSNYLEDGAKGLQRLYHYRITNPVGRFGWFCLLDGRHSQAGLGSFGVKKTH